MSAWATGYEERVRIGCERFEQICRRHDFTGEVSKALAKEWAHGIRDWLEEFGEDWPLLEAAVAWMRAAGLIVASPRSCIKVARDMRQWQPKAAEAPPGYWDEMRKRSGG